MGKSGKATGLQNLDSRVQISVEPPYVGLSSVVERRVVAANVVGSNPTGQPELRWWRNR